MLEYLQKSIYLTVKCWKHLISLTNYQLQMENLIDFENEQVLPRPKSPMDILMPVKLHGVKYSEDPFDHLEPPKYSEKADTTKELIDGSL